MLFLIIIVVALLILLNRPRPEPGNGNGNGNGGGGNIGPDQTNVTVSRGATTCFEARASSNWFSRQGDAAFQSVPGSSGHLIHCFNFSIAAIYQVEARSISETITWTVTVV